MIVSIIIWFTRKSATNFFSRYFVILLIAGIVPLYSDLMLWNWMFFHDNYTRTFALDHLSGVAIMGLPIAMIIRDKSTHAQKISEQNQSAREPSRPL